MPVLLKKTGIALVSGARTASLASQKFDANLDADRYKGIIVYFNISAGSGGTGLKVLIRGYDPFGNVYNLNSGGTAITASGKYIYQLYPSAAAPGASGSNIQEAVSGILPSVFDIQVVASDSTSYTYGVSFELIP